MYQVITLQEGSRHLNLCQDEGFRHQRCLFLFIDLTLIRATSIYVVTVGDSFSQNVSVLEPLILVGTVLHDQVWLL